MAKGFKKAFEKIGIDVDVVPANWSKVNV